MKNSILPNPEYVQYKKNLKKAESFYKLFIAPDNLVFDIGANYGHRVKVFLALKARVVAVEPQNKCASFLRGMFGHRVTVVQKGVGATDGEMDFYTSDNTALSSFSLDWINTVKQTDRFIGNEWNQPVKVPIVTLKGLISDYGKPDFLKVDVEGMEYDVFSTLAENISVISFEYAVPENIENLKKILAFLDKLSSYEFNYSAGETMSLRLQQWQGFADFSAHINTNDFIQTSAGDVYARLISIEK
jgi:FkbM family methyltransferase